MKAKPMITSTPNSMRKSVSMDSMPLPGPRVAALNEVKEAILDQIGPSSYPNLEFLPLFVLYKFKMLRSTLFWLS